MRADLRLIYYLQCFCGSYLLIVAWIRPASDLAPQMRRTEQAWNVVHRKSRIQQRMTANRMRILYIKPTSQRGPGDPILGELARSGHQVSLAAGWREALGMVGARTFGVVLIPEEIRGLEAYDFICQTHRARPDLLVFQLSVWRSDLREVLASIESSYQTVAVEADAPCVESVLQ